MSDSFMGVFLLTDFVQFFERQPDMTELVIESRAFGSNGTDLHLHVYDHYF